MKKSDIIRAWRDEEFRLSLSESERSQLPGNPAGVVELSDSELHGVDGAYTFTGGGQSFCGSVCFTAYCGGGGGCGGCGFEP